MDKKKLTENPLDDYTREPSLFDQAAISMAEQIATYADAVAEVVHDTVHNVVDYNKVDEATEEVNKVIDEIDDFLDKSETQRHQSYPSAFRGSCPDFKMGKIKQIILEQHWKDFQDYWNDHGYSHHESHTQELIFGLIMAIVTRLAIDHFIGIQQMQNDIAQLFTLQPTSIGNDMPSRLEIKPQIVEAMPRRLDVVWPVDDNEYNTSLFSDLIQQLSTNITKDIYANFIYHVRNVAPVATHSYKNDAKVSLQLYSEAIDIAKRSVRGAGNRIIASNAVAAALLRAGDVAVADDADRRYGHVNYIGTVGSAELYVDADLSNKGAFMFYKGVTETDAGLFYCPRHIVKCSGSTVSPDTLIPTIPLYTVSGFGNAMKIVDGNTIDASSDFITQIQINDIPYSIEDDRMLTELFDTKPLKTALINTTELYGAQKI